ncbi:MAG TPA: tetratricopeptide repeat protein, partial [Thermoanaerobaculia bacterium]|nr:tetratricopeptide repeat protein [Thermoanaerobaculia bacterium]
MLGDRGHCPAAETLAAFSDGRLTGAAHEETLRHVAHCAVCRSIVEDTVRFDADDEPRVVPHRAPRRRRYAAVAAAVAVATLAGMLLYRPLGSGIRSYRDGQAIHGLVAAAPTRFRSYEPRITGGFRWAPLRNSTRGPDSSDPEQLKIDGVAGAVLRDRKADGDPSHAAGVAYLLSGYEREAADELTRAATQQPRDARILTDLGVALYDRGTGISPDAAVLARALEVTDGALSLDPGLPEAHFNRALILERLGRRDDAIAAWRAFLAV